MLRSTWKRFNAGNEEQYARVQIPENAFSDLKREKQLLSKEKGKAVYVVDLYRERSVNRF